MWRRGEGGAASVEDSGDGCNYPFILRPPLFLEYLDSIPIAAIPVSAKPRTARVPGLDAFAPDGFGDVPRKKGDRYAVDLFTVDLFTLASMA